jgi:uncharacterized membrane-anchored protein
MKMKFWIAALVLVVAIVAIEFDIARRTEAQIKNQTSLKLNAQATRQVANETPAPAAIATVVKPATFESRFMSETQSMSQLQADPVVIEQKLEALALAATNEDIQVLAKIMQDPNRNGDERALAIEVLSRKKTAESLKSLESFVKNHEATTKQNWSRAQEFESVMRAQAIEGIAAYPQADSALTSLNALSEKVDESFLLDRIIRSSESIKGKAAATEVQDDAALKKLIE